MLATATILLTMTMTSMAIDVDKNNIEQEIDQPIIPLGEGEERSSTHHKVLGEQGTATWCVHCPSMGYWLSQVQGDFVYIALVADKNVYASGRCGELGLSGYPTTFFDGGYTSVVGHQYNVNNVQNAYDQCQARTVADLTVSLGSVIDEDTGRVDVVTFIDNNEDSDFNGRLRVYVVEITSRWDDYDGDPYSNALVGYANNIPVTISALDSLQISGTYTYPDLSADNTMIVATLFDLSSDYVQECTTAKPKKSTGGGGINLIPPVITIASPDDNEEVQGTIEITGSAHHPQGDGKLKWVLVKIDDNDWVSADGTSDWSYTWNTATVEDGEHYIRAVTSDGNLESRIYKVTVEVNNINYAPEVPAAPSGPIEGYAGDLYLYTVSTVDPDGDDIQYGLDWDGDEVVDEWADFVPSGTDIEVSHVWDSEGTYQVKVSAKDEYQEQSSFSPATTVTIHGENTIPTVTITNPQMGIYLNNEMLFPFFSTIIIGDIDIIADASDVETGIDYVELYIDGSYEDDSYSAPYEWTGMKLSFGRHTIRVIAYDTTGLSSDAEISVFKLF